MFDHSQIPLFKIENALLAQKQVTIYVKRDDLIHPQISGNKWRKLEHHIAAFRQGNFDAILSFGGAYSNHLYALAAAGQLLQIRTIGIVRGEKPITPNITLQFAEQAGMQLHYVSRTDYRNKNESDFLTALQENVGNVYIVPEGGAGVNGMKGCVNIAAETQEIHYDYVCCACGTGTTLAGITVGLEQFQVKAIPLGFAVLKQGDFLYVDIKNMLQNYYGNTSNLPHFELCLDYHFGGYAKQKPALLDFVQRFSEQYFPIEPVYTGKLFYGLFDLVEKNYFKPNTTILAIHTGGMRNSYEL
jgi:1-aminocyclopropane-1-carboxylate deaminase/D-cysteine desulfhydrase-like pyridoxal-dependent ACC family enzyme